MSPSLRIRPFQEGDLAFADGLREAAGWNQRIEDWRRFLAHEPGGCFVAEWEGAPAGTVTTTRHGEALGWIGMMLVAEEYRRRGIATALMERAMEYLWERGVASIALDATPEGAPVYERLGFRGLYELHRWRGEPGGHEAATREPLEFPLEFDREAFGADRSEWLIRLSTDAAAVRVNRNKGGQVNAFGMWRKGMRANYLGPSSAAEAEAGRKVVSDLLRSVSGETFWDIPEANASAVAVAGEHGFERVRHLLRMYAGEKWVDDDPSLQFALGDPATG